MINKITSKDLSSYDIFKDDKIKKEQYVGGIYGRN